MSASIELGDPYRFPQTPSFTRGDPYRFPRTPSFAWRATSETSEKLANRRRRLARLFDLNVVARAGDDDDARADDPLTEKPRVLRGRELVLVAADDERRRGDRRDAVHHVEDIARLE